MVSVLTASLRLNNGVEIPQVGLGVFRSARGAETRAAVAEAIRVGYRHVDTARIYGNEADVGAAIRKCGVPRADVFVTTKLWNDDQGYDGALRAFDRSAEQLGLGVIDLYLLHWPVPGRRLESWRALERLYEEKRVRAIGVSNFMESHLAELLVTAHVVPAVNQIETSPFHQQARVRAFCREHGIVVEAYSPLTKGVRLAHPVVTETAHRLRRTPAQVLLRWAVQQGLVVIPKSTHPHRIVENANLFDFVLDDEAMQALDGLDEELVTGWDPRGRP